MIYKVGKFLQRDPVFKNGSRVKRHCPFSLEVRPSWQIQKLFLSSFYSFYHEEGSEQKH